MYYVLSLAVLTATNSISAGPRVCTLSSISGPVYQCSPTIRIPGSHPFELQLEKIWNNSPNQSFGDLAANTPIHHQPTWKGPILFHRRIPSKQTFAEFHSIISISIRRYSLLQHPFQSLKLNCMYGIARIDIDRVQSERMLST